MLRGRSVGCVRSFKVQRHFLVSSGWNPLHSTASTAAAVGSGVSGGAKRFLVTSVPVGALDPFVRTRIVQFLKKSAAAADVLGKLGGAASSAESRLIHSTTINTVADGGGSTVLHRTIVLLPLGEGIGIARAIGFGPSQNAAEAAAAIHAERVVDAHHVCMYALPKMQARHAATARAAGREAPDHGAEPRAMPLSRLPLPVVAPKCVAQPTDADISAAQETADKLVADLVAGNVGAASKSVGDGEVDNGAGNVATVAAALASKSSRPGTFKQANAAMAERAVGQAAYRGELDYGKLDEIENRKKRQLLNHFARVAPKKGVDETEQGEYELVCVKTNRCDVPNVIVSPCLVCFSSLERIQEYFHRIAGQPFEACTSITMDKFDKEEFAVVTCELPFTVFVAVRDAEGNPVAGGLTKEVKPLAKGKATTERNATSLCAMHSELLIDYYRQPLFPSGSDAGADHERALECYGRPRVPLPSTLPNQAEATGPPPKPLKELHPLLNEYQYLGMRRAPLSKEELLLRTHNEVYNNAKTCVDVDVVDEFFEVPGFDTFEDAEEQLANFQRLYGMRQLWFNFTELGPSNFRCTLLLHNLGTAARMQREGHPHGAPLPLDESDVISRHMDAPPSSDNNQKATNPSMDDGGERIVPMGALGTAPSMETSRRSCVVHALDIINRLNLKVFPRPEDSGRQDAYVAARKKVHLYAPVSYGEPPPQTFIAKKGTSDIRPDEKETRNKAPVSYAGTAKRNFTPVRGDAMMLEADIPLLAYSGPSIYSADHRAPIQPPYVEEQSACRLHTISDFVPFPTSMIGEVMHLLTSCVGNFCHFFKQPQPQRLREVTTTTWPLVRTISQDPGSGWRHRCTAWRHLWFYNIRTKQHEIFTAIGRSPRSKDASRLCFVHMQLLVVDLLGIDVLMKHIPREFRTKLTACFEKLGRETQQLSFLCDTARRRPTYMIPQWCDSKRVTVFDDAVVPLQIRHTCPPLVDSEMLKLYKKNATSYERVHERHLVEHELGPVQRTPRFDD